jgi:TolB-like protein/Tfp pilus assembly protein PilF
VSDPTTTAAVFLSYAREDTDAARRIADALRGFGVEVWFDQNELRGGDTWDQKIRGQIRTCTLFVAVISANTQSRPEGYFRREWKIAVERSHDIADGVPFIVPVVIDATAESAALVPEQFMKVQWTRLAGGIPTPEFVAQTKRLLAPRRATAAAGVAGVAPAASAPSSKTPLVAVATIAVIAIGAAVFFALRPAAKEKAPAAEPAKAVVETKAAPAPVALPDAARKISDKSIAVLPFTNMSEEKDSAFFADGVHEDLLTNLALVPELKVISRTTVTQYRDSKKTLRQIGEELGVAYVLEGSVRRVGNKVRVTGQLINARTDEHVWAKSYDRDLTDIFAIQSSLSQEIASALQAAITPQAQKFLERRPTENPVAYDAFLKGRTIRNTMISGRPAPLKQAEEDFQTAVDQDPKFAAAWGELAVAHALHAFWEIDKTPARLARGDAAIAHALELAPDSPDVISQVGTYAYYAHRDYAKATEQYERLARLKPNDPTVFSSLGLIQRRQGRWAESLVNSRKAAELDPGNVGYSRNLIATLFSGRRWEEAIAEQRRLATLLDGSAHVAVLGAVTRFQFYATGSAREMDSFLANLTPAEANSPREISQRKVMAAERGDWAEAIRLDQLQPYFDDGGEQRYVQAMDAALVLAASGDLAAARRRLGDFPAELHARMLSEPTNARIRGELGVMEALLGHGTEAMQLARQGAEMLPESRDALDGVNFTFWALVQVYAWTGDKDRAIEGVAHILRVPSQAGGIYLLHSGPWLTPLRGDPRFEALLNDPKNNAPLF